HETSNLHSLSLDALRTISFCSLYHIIYHIRGVSRKSFRGYCSDPRRQKRGRFSELTRGCHTRSDRCRMKRYSLLRHLRKHGCYLKRVGIEGLLAGRRSGESKKSLERWLASRSE